MSHFPDATHGPWFLPDEASTKAAGLILGQHLAPHDALGLSGDLGAGKTCLTAALVRGIYQKAKQPMPRDLRVTSPTYTLVNLYPAPDPITQIAHFDLYRLHDLDDLESTGYWDLLEDSPLVIMEWINQVEGAWPEEAWAIHLEHREEGRTLHATRHTRQETQCPRFQALCVAWDLAFGKGEV